MSFPSPFPRFYSAQRNLIFCCGRCNVLWRARRLSATCHRFFFAMYSRSIPPIISSSLRCCPRRLWFLRNVRDKEFSALSAALSFVILFVLKTRAQQFSRLFVQLEKVEESITGLVSLSRRHVPFCSSENLKQFITGVNLIPLLGRPSKVWER